MPFETYTTLPSPMITPPTGDEIALHILDMHTAGPWIDALSEAQKTYLDLHNFVAKPGGTALLTNPDGSPDKAFLVISDDPIWQAAACARNLPAGAYHLVGADLSDDLADMICLGFLLASYQPALEGKITDQAPLASLRSAHETTRVNALAKGTILCRDLINAPANKMTPAILASEASTLAEAYGARLTITSGKSLEEAFPAIHTVGRAAEIAPCLIDMRWGTQGPAITLIGKGVTFDSGGLDLKPSKAMEMMKKDMGGSAHVLGLALAIMMTGLPVRLRVLIGAAENAVSEKSMRPMDVIDTRKGLKVEVGNTDAEGRLVLADALDLACEDAPDFIVDFATLTGAARVALGTSLPALFCNLDETAHAITTAGLAEKDPLWRLPLFEPYDAQLDAGHMALSSTGNSGFGGAITAALFLRRFTGKQINWAHIDVMAWNLASAPGRPRGGEAMGLRAMYRYIEQLADH